eukprot:297841-Rhodomonas_salina.3
MGGTELCMLLRSCYKMCEHRMPARYSNPRLHRYPSLSPYAVSGTDVVYVPTLARYFHSLCPYACTVLKRRIVLSPYPVLRHDMVLCGARYSF